MFSPTACAQLHESLRTDSRVTSLEGVNARELTADQLPRNSFGLVVVDVSFISLQKVLPSVWPLLDSALPGARLVALVKPQFEAGKEAVAKGKGLVKDVVVQRRVLDDVMGFARSELAGCSVVGSMVSPILGGDGQREFLISLAHAEHGELLEPRGPFLGAIDDDDAEGRSGAASSEVDSKDVVEDAFADFFVDDGSGATLKAGTAARAAAAAEAEAEARAADLSDGLIPIRASRPSTAASRSSKYAKQKELNSLRSGKDRAGKTDGRQLLEDLGVPKSELGSVSRRKQSKGARGRKNKQHRQSAD